MTPMLARTLELLEDRARLNLSLPAIAHGAGVGFEWLRKLDKGEFEDPGVRKIEALHTFLTTADRRARRKVA